MERAHVPPRLPRGSRTYNAGRTDRGGTMNATPTTASPMPAEQRRQIVDSAVAEFVSGGWRVESRSDFQVVFQKGKRPNHILHLILTIVTVGLWGIVWLILSLTSHEKRMVVTIDEQGRRTGSWS